jgi:hypothetical protein
VIGVQVDVVEVEGPFINPKIVPERIECRRPKSAFTGDVDQRSFVDDDRGAERHAIRLNAVLLSARCR